MQAISIFDLQDIRTFSESFIEATDAIKDLIDRGDEFQNLEVRNMQAYGYGYFKYTSVKHLLKGTNFIDMNLVGHVLKSSKIVKICVSKNWDEK